MKLQTTNSLRDFKQFLKELKQDKEKYDELYKLSIGFYFLISVIICSFFCLFFILPFSYKISFLTFLVINFVLIYIFVFIAHKSDYYFLFSTTWYVKRNMYIRDNRYIEQDGLLKHTTVRIFFLERYYETENFYAILFSYHGFISFDLIKKTDDTPSSIKTTFDFLTSVDYDGKESKEEKYAAFQSFLVFISIVLYLFMFFMLGKVIEIDSELVREPFRVKKNNIINIIPGSTYWELGLRTFDIPFYINGDFVASDDLMTLEKKLMRKNIKLNVRKFKNGKREDYIINKN